MNQPSKKSRKEKQPINVAAFIAEDELEENSKQESSSVKSSDGSQISEYLQQPLATIGKGQKIMLMKMLKKLFKILYQSPEITDLRNKLKNVRQIKTFVVHTNRPAVQVITGRAAENSYTCPITKKIHDNVLEMILFTVLAHAEVHVKAQIKDGKNLLILYYEVGNWETFPSLKKPCYNPMPISKSLSLFETKLKIFTQAKVARKITKQSSELDRLVRRIGFTQEESLKLAKTGEQDGFYSNKQNIGRPELFQYRLLRALVQNIFIFESITSDTLLALMPEYSRDMISPLPKFKGLNFIKPEHFSNGNMSHGIFKKYYAKFEEKFEKLIQKTALFRSRPLGVPLKFEDVLVESEGEIDYELENHCVASQLATNPNLTIEEKLIMALYNRQYQTLLQFLDFTQQSALFCFYPGSVLTFPAQVCRSCIEILQGDHLLASMGAFLTLLRLADTISQSDFEDMIAMCSN